MKPKNKKIGIHLRRRMTSRLGLHMRALQMTFRLGRRRKMWKREETITRMNGQMITFIATKMCLIHRWPRRRGRRRVQMQQRGRREWREKGAIEIASLQ
jgi:hypothetical protein